MFLFRKKSLIFILISGTLWQLIVDLLILKIISNWQLGSLLTKTGIFRGKSDTNMEVYTKSQHESCFLASRLLYLIVVSPPDRRYKIAVVCDDGFTEVSPCQV